MMKSSPALLTCAAVVGGLLLFDLHAIAAPVIITKDGRPEAQIIVGQGAAGYASPDAEMVEITSMGTKANLYVAQALAIGQLSD